MIEPFSGESPEAIRQDVHAKIFTANLAKAMAYPQEQETPANIRKAYVPNLTYAIASLRYRLFGWLLQKIEPAQVLAILDLIAKTQQRQRPGQSSPRHKTQPKPRRPHK